MSSFASRTQKTIENPFDKPHTFTIHRLSGGATERAEAEHLRKFVLGLTPRGWAKKFHAVIEHGRAKAEDIAAAIRDPLAGLDRATVVREALVGWSYTEVVDGKETPLTVNEKAIDDLDDETVEYLATEIMKLTKPSLFATPEEQETARKKD